MPSYPIVSGAFSGLWYPIGMRILGIFAALLMASPVSAGRFVIKSAPVKPFVPSYLQSVSISLAQDPLFAGRMLQQFDLHLSAVLSMRSPEEVGEYLRAEILAAEDGSARTLKQVNAALGEKGLDPRAASALLLANSLARPDQTVELLVGMERQREAWGQHAGHILQSVGHAFGRSPAFVSMLYEIGKQVKPLPHLTRYDAGGRLKGIFDGGR